MSCVSPFPSRSSASSDYGTGGSTCYSDDDQPFSVGFTHNQPGICPHCKLPFQEPLTLQCGHSLCADCVSELLSATTPPLRPCRIRMGLRSYNLQKRVSPTAYRSPACVVCREPPKSIPPVRNLELQLLLRSLVAPREHPAFRDNLKRNLSAVEVKEETFFRQCKVAIVGARSVGKSSLKRVQIGNSIVFNDILGISSGSDYLMIEMADDNDCENSISAADGFVLVYSITDQKSFLFVQDLFSFLVARRGPSVPVVLVASKADLGSERSVSAFKGQSLARHRGCPFLEVSAKKNDCVHEAFKELVRLIEIQRLQLSVV